MYYILYETRNWGVCLRLTAKILQSASIIGLQVIFEEMTSKLTRQAQARPQFLLLKLEYAGIASISYIYLPANSDRPPASMRRIFEGEGITDRSSSYLNT